MKIRMPRLLHVLIVLLLGSCCCFGSLCFLGAGINYQRVAEGPVEDLSEVGYGDDVLIEGVVETEEPSILGELQAGCRIDLSKDSPVLVVNESLRYEVQTDFGPVRIVLEQCPDEGTIVVKDPDEEGFGWKGLAEGTRIMVEGEISSLDPLVLQAEEFATGDRIPRWKRDLNRPEIYGMICTGLMVIGPLGGFFVLISGPNARVRWGKLAQQQGWHFQGHLLSPGVIRGHLGSSSFEVCRMGRLGDHGILPGRTEIKLFLPEHLPSRIVLPLVRSVRGPGHDPTELSQFIDQLEQGEQTLETQPGQAVLILESMAPEQIQQGLENMGRFVRLLEDVVLTELDQLAKSRNWTLDLGREWEVFDSQEHRVLYYRPHDPVRYELSLPLPSGAPAELRIQAKGVAQPGIHLADPILHQFISMNCTEPERLQDILRKPGATERVMDLVKGHEGEVVDGCIRVIRSEYLPSPTAVWESMEALAELLSS